MHKIKQVGKDIMVAFVVILVVVAGLAFYGGMKYSQSHRSQFVAGQFPGGAMSGQTGNRMMRGGGMVNGEILSMDDKSVTVKDRTGGSKILFIAPSTEMMKTVTGTVADLTVGANIMAQGTPNSDGSITATSIQLRPANVPGIGAPTKGPANGGPTGSYGE